MKTLEDFQQQVLTPLRKERETTSRTQREKLALTLLLSI